MRQTSTLRNKIFPISLIKTASLETTQMHLPLCKFWMQIAFIWSKRLCVKVDELEQTCSRCIFSHSFSAIKFMGFSRQMVSKNVTNHQLFSNWLSILSIIWISYFLIFSLLTFGLSTILLQMALSQRIHRASEWRDGSRAGSLVVSHSGPHQPWASLEAENRL